MRYFILAFCDRNMVGISLLLLVINRDVYSQQNDSLAAFKKITDKTGKTTIINYRTDTLVFNAPKLFSFVTNVPSDLLYIAKTPFKKKSLPGHHGL